MSEWTWSLTKKASKDLRALDKKLQRKIVEALDLLIQQSPSCQVKKLKAMDDLWRLRVGDWRIVFRKENKVLTILVIEIVRRTTTTY